MDGREPVDAVVLAGGRFDDEMAAATGVRRRALAEFEGRPFVEWVLDALRQSGTIDRTIVVGPPELAPHAPPGALVPERSGIVENLLAGLDACDGGADVLITASDNPLLSAGAFGDFIRRAPRDAAVAYPILSHAAFLDRFPGADNIPVRLRDGTWIGGGCALIGRPSLDRLRGIVASVLLARKSKWRMVRLLGPGFLLRFALRLATVDSVERRASAIVGGPVCFVRDCDPAFAIDIDEPVDLDYILRWARTRSANSTDEWKANRE